MARCKDSSGLSPTDQISRRPLKRSPISSTPSDTAERMSPMGPGTAAAALSSACVKMLTNA